MTTALLMALILSPFPQEKETLAPLPGLKKAFNESDAEVRMILILSPL